ncbi:MAG TPA: hypothetical protein VLW86_07900 [Syntrophorhabdales bacterium]|nr:hypothetical protein [Syntrophorhabdales bacterium]
MDDFITGATERITIDDREGGVGALRGSPAPSIDHLRRLCASLEEATRLVSPAGGVLVHDEASSACHAYSLDVLAFAIAVDAVLFLDEVSEGVPLPRDTRAWLRRTLTAFDRLLHFLDASQQSDPMAAEIEGSLRDARETLGKTAKALRARLAARCGFRVLAEFLSRGPMDGKAVNRAGSNRGGGEN